jgi:hypothetical protein
VLPPHLAVVVQLGGQALGSLAGGAIAPEPALPVAPASDEVEGPPALVVLAEPPDESAPPTELTALPAEPPPILTVGPGATDEQPSPVMPSTSSEPRPMNEIA